MLIYSEGQGAINGVKTIECGETELTAALAIVNVAGQEPTIRQGSCIICTKTTGLVVYKFDEAANAWRKIA